MPHTRAMYGAGNHRQRWSSAGCPVTVPDKDHLAFLRGWLRKKTAITYDAGRASCGGLEDRASFSMTNNAYDGDHGGGDSVSGWTFPPTSGSCAV